MSWLACQTTYKKNSEPQRKMCVFIVVAANFLLSKTGWDGKPVAHTRCDRSAVLLILLSICSLLWLRDVSPLYVCRRRLLLLIASLSFPLSLSN